MHHADEAKGQSKKKRAIGGVAHSLAARHPPSPVVDLGLAQAPELELHRVALQKEDPPSQHHCGAGSVADTCLENSHQAANKRAEGGGGRTRPENKASKPRSRICLRDQRVWRVRLQLAQAKWSPIGLTHEWIVCVESAHM